MGNDFLTKEKEIWVPIKNFENFYEVSNYGRVRSLRKNIILSPAKHKDGYLHVVLYRSHMDKKTVDIHRLVAEAFVPNPDNLPLVMHEDENPEHNFAWNLKWGTDAENAKYPLHRQRISNKNKGHKDSDDARKLKSDAHKKYILCGGKTFHGIEECAKYYDVPYYMLGGYLRGTFKMPKIFEEMGLRYK